MARWPLQALRIDPRAIQGMFYRLGVDADVSFLGLGPISHRGARPRHASAGVDQPPTPKLYRPDGMGDGASDPRGRPTGPGRERAHPQPQIRDPPHRDTKGARKRARSTLGHEGAATRKDMGECERAPQTQISPTGTRSAPLA